MEIPKQLALDLVMDRVRSVRVFKDGCAGDTLMDNTMLLEVNEPIQVTALRLALRIVDGSGGHCMCYGNPTLELLDVDGVRLALLGLHQGRSIRWKQWEDDALLVDGRLVLKWLAEHGVIEPLSRFQQEEEGERKRKEVWNCWVNAMPRYLKDETFQPVARTLDWAFLLTAAEKACPDMRERISTLFEWYGKGIGSWSQYPDWEQVAERLLLTFPHSSLFDAAASPLLTEAGLEGAARLFAGTTFQTDGQKRAAYTSLSFGYSGFEVFEPIRSGGPVKMPAVLRRRLWDHCQMSNDPDKRQRGESAFGGAQPDT